MLGINVWVGFLYAQALYVRQSDGRCYAEDACDQARESAGLIRIHFRPPRPNSCRKAQGLNTHKGGALVPCTYSPSVMEQRPYAGDTRGRSP